MSRLRIYNGGTGLLVYDTGAGAVGDETDDRVRRAFREGLLLRYDPDGHLWCHVQLYRRAPEQFLAVYDAPDAPDLLGSFVDALERAVEEKGWDVVDREASDQAIVARLLETGGVLPDGAGVRRRLDDHLREHLPDPSVADLETVLDGDVPLDVGVPDRETALSVLGVVRRDLGDRPLVVSHSGRTDATDDDTVVVTPDDGLTAVVVGERTLGAVRDRALARRRKCATDRLDRLAAAVGAGWPRDAQPALDAVDAADRLGIAVRAPRDDLRPRLGLGVRAAVAVVAVLVLYRVGRGLGSATLRLASRSVPLVGGRLVLPDVGTVDVAVSVPGWGVLGVCGGVLAVTALSMRSVRGSVRRSVVALADGLVWVSSESEPVADDVRKRADEAVSALEGVQRFADDAGDVTALVEEAGLAVDGRAPREALAVAAPLVGVVAGLAVGLLAWRALDRAATALTTALLANGRAVVVGVALVTAALAGGRLLVALRGR